ncbi:MAG: transposase, partial [Bacteroidota bacterium]
VMSYADSIHCKGVEEGLVRGRLEGKQEGKQEGILQTAKNLLHQGVEMGAIALATGLQREELLQLR